VRIPPKGLPARLPGRLRLLLESQCMPHPRTCWHARQVAAHPGLLTAPHRSAPHHMPCGADKLPFSPTFCVQVVVHLGPAYQICLQPTMLFIEAKYERWPRAPGWSKARAPPLPPAAAAPPLPLPLPAATGRACAATMHGCRRCASKPACPSAAAPLRLPTQLCVCVCVCVQGLALRLWFRSSCVVAITFLAILMPWFGTIIGLSGALSEWGGWVGLPAVPPPPAFLPPARLARPR
jgi:hypothetical protein